MFKKQWVWTGVTALFGLLLVSMFSAYAKAQTSDFSLQVTPSPLVATVKPGQATDLELKIRNSGTGTEDLKIEPRKFTVDKQTGEVKFDDTEVPEIAPWVKFPSPTFKVKAGEWTSQKIRVSLPKETGFSYSLALVISRTNSPKSVESGRLIKGSVAVFTLINVDRPGATRKLDVTEFKPSQTVYEYLPVELETTFRNSGNTITRPYGNIFIQRGSNDADPIATLPVNDVGGYLLPDTPRTLSSKWEDGFPVFTTKLASDGSEKRELEVDWSKLSDFRIGLYTAKLVAIYNDGQRDIPVEREFTFWVIPWRTMLIAAVVIGLIAYLRHKQIQRKTRKAVQKALQERDKKQGKNDEK